MKNALILARKDYHSYFHSWMGVGTLFLFYLVGGIFFSVLSVSYAKVSLEVVKNTGPSIQGLGLTRFVFGSYYLNMGTLFMFFIPLISMRSFAEEKKMHTLEAVFTYPLSDSEIVWGKFLGMVRFLITLILPTGFYVVLIQGLGGQFDWQPLLIGATGFLVLGISYLALGLFVSSISQNQMTSAMATFGALLFFWILDWVATITDGKWAHFFSGFSPLKHYQSFTVGVLDLSDITFFVFFTLYFLFLTLRSVETRNWEG